MSGTDIEAVAEGFLELGRVQVPGRTFRNESGVGAQAED